MRYTTITPVKRYHKINKQIERLPKRDLEQRNLTMGQLLDTHFPMSGLATGGDTGTRGRVSTNLSDAVLLTLHMVWMDTTEDRYADFSDWFHDSAIHRTFPTDGSIPTIPPTAPSDTTPTAPQATTSAAPPAPTVHTAIDDEPVVISDDGMPTTPEQCPGLAPPLHSDSEPELPACQPVINRKVSLVRSHHNKLVCT
jgi:hypothetical protein